MVDDTTTDLIELKIDKLITGGAGLARHEGLAVFVPLTAPGDRVRARVTTRRKQYWQAELVEILEPGAGRCDAPCPHFGDCGGCDLQHLDPERQHEAKIGIVTDCFTRLAKLDVEPALVRPVLADTAFGYRNKIRLFAHPSGHYGLKRRGSDDVVPIGGCPLLPELFNDRILPWLKTLPPCEQVVVKLDGRGGWLVSLFGPPNRLRALKRILAEISGDVPPADGCQGLLYNNLPLWGRDYLVVEVGGGKYRVGARSFFQNNLAVTERALTTLTAWLADSRPTGGLLADLYCGVGLLTLALADRFDRIVAADTDPFAIRDAENNVRRDRRTRDKTTVVRAAAADQLRSEEAWSDACVVLDPPRTGLQAAGVGALAAAAPRDVFYMSCDPATLARDTAGLAAAGYAPSRLALLDMFPQTAHVECLLQMRRR
jgi:23S rRNA (uracil1939-C5)-methyltransferase